MNKDFDNDCLLPNITVNEEIVSRRVVLKRALTFGYGALIPIVLIGCDSNDGNGSTRTSAAPAGTPDSVENSSTAPSGASNSVAPPAAAPSSTSEAGANAPAATPATGMVSQASVRYQDQPNGEQRCDGCVLFVEPNACSVVEGDISPEGWCTIWAPKAS